MKLLMIGCGSIGTRHAKNAKAKGHDLLLFDVDASRSNALAAEVGGKSVSSIQEGLALRPDAALICTPPNMHIENALDCIKENIPVFIEKPLSNSMENIYELARESEKRNVLTMVACNLRFTAGLQKVKELLPKLGKLQWANIDFGYDLRKWRPNQDYRKNYAASHEMGGGIALDAIHELDYLCWLFGKVVKGSASIVHTGQLEIKTEDCVDYSLETENCRKVNVHLDYLHPTYKRGCTIFGERGSLTWEFTSGDIHLSINGEEHMIKTNADVNVMYTAELDYFLDCLASRRQAMNSVKEAAEILDYALKLRDHKVLP